MRRKLFWSVSIIMMTVIFSGCGNTDSKVNQVIQYQIQEIDNKKGQSEQEIEAVKDKASETVEDKSPETTEELQSETVTADNTTGNTEWNTAGNTAENISEGNIDVDLTKLSSTMVYSEVYNMLYIPENYIGKTVKMRGMFVVYTNMDESQYYPAVIIADATACCAQGLEFILKGNPTYPEGYPEMETEITVVGTFETYLEDGNTYCRLQNAQIEQL